MIFYAAYPVLRWISRSRAALYVITGATLIAFTVLHRYLTMGHMLWLTAWSFVFGVFAQRVDLRLSLVWSLGLATALAVLMFVLNTEFGFNLLNYYFIVGMSVLVVVGLKTSELPRRPFAPLRALSGIVLGIYFLHTYLSFHWTGYRALDLLISLACIIGVAWPLNRVASLLRRPLAVCLGEVRPRGTPT